MKKIKAGLIFIFAAALMLLPILSGCGKDGGDKKEAKEMLYDPGFSSGFKILGLDSRYDGNTAFGYIDYGGTVTSTSYLWRLAQWGTRGEFDLGASIDNGDTGGKDGDYYVYENGGKRVKVKPGGGEIYLKVKGDAEYPTPRVANQAWPHLLLEQAIPSGGARLADMESLILKLDFEMTEFTDHMTKAQYNSGLHSAQFQWIFTVQNVNQSTLGLKNDYYWFNVGYFDKRYDYPPKMGHFDGGKDDATSKYIYAPDTKDFLKKPVAVGDRQTVEFDVLPYFKAGFDEAIGKGALAGTKYEDLTLTTTNIGWEVTGTYTCEMAIYGMSMQYTLK